MKKPILLILLLVSISSMAQKQGIELIDSLKTRLNSSLADTGKVRLLGKISFQYFRFDTDSGIYYAKQAITLAEELHWKTGLAFSNNYLGTNYAVKGDFPAALEYFGKSLSIYTEIGDKQGIAFLTNNLGNFYRIQKDFPKSIEYINKAILVNQELNSKLDLVKNYNNLGSVYADLADIPKSDQFYNMALHLAREIKDKEQITLLLINLADNRTHRKDYCRGLELCSEAIKICQEAGDIYNLAMDYGYMGEIYQKLSDDPAFNYKNCGTLSKDKRNNLLEAKNYLQRSIELLVRVNDQALISEYALILSTVYEKLGETENALKYYKQYTSNKDSVFSKDNSIKLANIEKKQDGELKDKQIKIQKLEIEKKNVQISLFILVLLLVLLFSYFYNKLKSNKLHRENEEKYRFLFENNPQPMFIYDLDTLAFLEINKAAVNHYGYSMDEFLCMSIKDIRPKEDIPALMDEIDLIRSKGQMNPLSEWKHLKKNGELIDVELTAQPVISKGKNARHVLVNDITDRKRAEEELRLNGEIIEHMAEGIILTRSSDGTIVYVNRAASQMFGAYRGELNGRHISSLNAQTEKDPGEIAGDILQVLNRTGLWEGEVKNVRVDGTVFWSYAQVTFFNHPKFGDVWVAIHQDITEKKKMVEDLTFAKEKAEESDHLKTAFLNNISHEIRTPFNGILGYLQLMQEEGVSADERAEFFLIINKSADRLMKTINDIVEISEIQSGQIKVRITATNVHLLANQVFESFKPEAENKKLDFRVNQPLDFGHIQTDGEKLKTILSVLVENGIKFTNSGFVEFGYQLALTGNDREFLSTEHGLQAEGGESGNAWPSVIEFYVKDTGVGIPKNKQQVIFDRFRQADVSNTRHFEGSGLGLSIAKAYVEMLGGTFRVESEPGIGSVFIFTIPNQSITGHETSLSNEDTEVGFESLMPGLKILITDDDPSSGRLLSLMVRRSGIEIMNVATGQEAIEICRNIPDIDLILMDIKMPLMDGYETTRQIRQFNKDVVIIAQTAYAFSGERDRALEAGCDDYISKPILKKELTRLIKKYLYQ